MNTTKWVVVYLENDSNRREKFLENFKDVLEIKLFENGSQFLQNFKNDFKIQAVISYIDLKEQSPVALLNLLKTAPELKGVPVIFVLNKLENGILESLVKGGISDVFVENVNKEDFLFRLNYLVERSQKGAYRKQEDLMVDYKLPFAKRAFDVIFSLILIILFSPILFLIGLLIRLESKGPVIYKSKRVGTGYQIFDFYKFRSMSLNADKMLKGMAYLNQYNQNESKRGKVEGSDGSKEGLCFECKAKGTPCQSKLYFDENIICEKLFLKEKKQKEGAAFVKISKDPRVTKIGQFIRNTSLDELPQLFNVLKGDMSIVGNRPLPLYEAEKITTDKYTLRFMAPAGITGFWQITKRGRGKMTEEERIELDNYYALNNSLRGDLLIIIKTIPALLQKENV